jgi:hypothetical protein
MSGREFTEADSRFEPTEAVNWIFLPLLLWRRRQGESLAVELGWFRGSKHADERPALPSVVHGKEPKEKQVSKNFAHFLHN